MRIKPMVCLLCLLCAPLQARDPFHPLVTDRCAQPQASQEEWRLMGVLGRQGDYRAWLVHKPQRTVIAINQQQPQPLPGWQLLTLNPQELTLRLESDCTDLRWRFHLHGASRD